ncbi:MAG: immune inhibitor A [Candidatus Poseidonia sp.]|nr:immune inhibitor A [Poseidonia sp.]
MKRFVTLFLSLLFLCSGLWAWVNDETIDDWIVQQVITANEDHPDLLGLQTNETWFVVVVDFPDFPATEAWGIDEAENLVTQSAVDYLDQLSGGTTEFDVIVHEEVVRATSNLAVYGEDNDARDTDSKGTFLPNQLATYVIEAIKDDVEWSEFDLDGNGEVDRLLILHSTKGQEENPSRTERIWSHFTHFEEPIGVEDSMLAHHYTMASLQTGTSGVGTILHEMMHQMGAVDLYPVHDETSFQSWKGLGDWDIMASGNWNGAGRWPALPTGASMELLDSPRIINLDLTWPAGTSQPCLGPTITMEGTSEGGEILRVPLGTNEAVFIELRTDFGYDSRLPGHGVLVTYQDQSVGDIDDNEVNTNPNLPWLMVIEADGRQDLVSGANQGEASDAFTNGSQFGANGVEIRTHDGVLVPWTAKVLIENETTIEFTSMNCSPNVLLNLPDHGATILSTGTIDTEVPITTICSSQLSSSDGRVVEMTPHESETYHLNFSSNGTPNSIAVLTGLIECGDDVFDIEYTVHTLNRIPIESYYSGQVNVDSNTLLEVPIDSLGANSQRLSVHIDGALARVSSGATSVTLGENSTYALTIEPNGLLVNNMIVQGTIELHTEEGQQWVIQIELTAEREDEEFLATYRTPGRIIAILMFTLTLYFAAMSLQVPAKETTTINTDAKSIEPQEATPTDEDIDPWGRVLDEPST